MLKQHQSNTPILVANEEWSLPEDLRSAVKQERMINSLLNIVKKDMDYTDLVGDAEVVAYLMPASQTYSLSHNWTQIYLYCSTRYLQKSKKEIPNNIKVEKLTENQMRDLNHLKNWIFEKRGGKEKNPVINALNEVFNKK